MVSRGVCAPQVLTDQLGRIDALVASWLPGSEGTGVADVLVGRAPFTARLPMTWPRSADQVPIKVGDRDYRPQYPEFLGANACRWRGRFRRPSAAPVLSRTAS
jgi:hypothetical protein